MFHDIITVKILLFLEISFYSNYYHFVYSKSHSHTYIDIDFKTSKVNTTIRQISLDIDLLQTLCLHKINIPNNSRFKINIPICSCLQLGGVFRMKLKSEHSLVEKKEEWSNKKQLQQSLADGAANASAIVIISKIKKESFLTVTRYEMPLSVPNRHLMLKPFYINRSSVDLLHINLGV